jgi:hexokinase
MRGNAPGIDRFLRVNRMDAARIDLRACCAAFIDEMTRGLEARPSSLPMIPTYIETARAVERGRRVVALDAGGTNMRVAVVSFDDRGTPVVEDLTRHRMPGVDAAMERDEFFKALADVVLPAMRKSDRIGFCFSYPAEIMPDKDGRLLHFTKEIKAKGVEGQMVGAGLRRALVAGGAREPIRVVLLNDTVATLLAGRNAMPDRRFDDFIGIVCGTGLNAAYVERNALIRKTAGLDPAGSQIVNTESGSFARGVHGGVDDGFDATMANPGRYRHEKTISGAYLGALCLYAARQAARDGLMSGATARELDKVASLDTRELNDFLLHPDSLGNPLSVACGRAGGTGGAGAQGAAGTDARTLYRLCDSIVERAAAMVAVNLAAVLVKTGKGMDPRYPVCIAVDGTTFWQLRTFHARVESHMRTILRGRWERAWEIASVDDAPLLGAAIAALTN